jgi:hypothetical protein
MNKNDWYVLEFLRKVHPKHRTLNELSWWFVTMDKVGSAIELKESLKKLKSRRLIRYTDPIGWQATA